MGATILLLRRTSPPRLEDPGFYQELQSYDLYLESIRGDTEGVENLSTLLDRLEQQDPGLEIQLAALKRRRNLALGRAAPVYTQSQRGVFVTHYKGAAERLIRLFPNSEQVKLFAADAFLLERPLGLQDRTELSRYARIYDPRFRTAAISLQILSGSLTNPRSLAATSEENLRQMEDFFDPLLNLVSGPEWERYMINRALLYAQGGDRNLSLGTVSDLLQSAESLESFRFAAGYFYHRRDFERAAELFGRFLDEQSRILRADALLLGGLTDNAVSLYRLIAAEPVETPWEERWRARSLYNLAGAAPNRRDSRLLLEELTALPLPPEDDAALYGLIRYSRLLDNNRQAQALLRDHNHQDQDFLDLELVRRRRETLPPDRSIAETWMLLERHPNNEDLYRWAAYYFDFQQRYGETALLLRSAAQRGMGDVPWIEFSQALNAVRSGRVAEGEAAFLTMAGPKAPWQVYANLGRIQESLRAPSRGIEYYSTALERVRNNREAARIQFGISRCFRALGQDRESRRALEYARSLDPDNLNVRLELDRYSTY
jgi:tetratricopeptide (TPR) repeat protein